MHLGKYIWDKVFKSALIKFCGRQHLKNLLSPLLYFVSLASPENFNFQILIGYFI